MNTEHWPGRYQKPGFNGILMKTSTRGLHHSCKPEAIIKELKTKDLR